MAQSNVAREPSMDEILASIRKIIESNEASGPGLPANDQGPVSDNAYRADRPYLDDEAEEDIHLTVDDGVFAQAFDDVETYADTGAAQPRPFPVQEPARASAGAPLSLADVAARVRAASERQAQPRAPQQSGRDMPFPAPVAAEPAARTDPAPQPRDVPPPIAEAQPTEVVNPAAPAQIEAVSEPAPVSVTSAAARGDSAIETAAPDISAPQTGGPQAPVPAVVREPAAIVSDAVGEQVSRAFGDLALALDSSPRRSFDEIAEDMLRPMLQEWLDDNLPTMVERLVREEIERVARGPRR